ncbi:MAG: sodium-dependent bicarbonate transport family permease [Chloroflexi bacterium]|nr:sodium-dependent bicarbonate transport family permease [Chloroflexota bacterium]
MALLDVIRINLLSPMVLAFILGVLAVIVKTDLSIPRQVYSVISIYLLFAIGLKGGFDLASTTMADFGLAAIVAALIGAGIPVWSYLILHYFGRFDEVNSVAISLHYGGVSAATLSACVTFLAEVGQGFEGFMPTMYVLMELPAVAVALLIANARLSESAQVGDVLRSALTGKSMLLLGGGVLIGYASGAVGASQVAPFFVDLFPGVLVIFLLDMGTVVGKRLSDLRDAGPFLLAFGVVMPLLHGLLGTGLGSWIGLSVGGSMIMGVLAASASFITAPAVVQANLPDANPGYYLTAPLVISFPFNLVIGLPIYFELALLLVG